MTKNKGYEEYEVVRNLNKKHDVKVNPEEHSIKMLYGKLAKGDVGIRSKGKIDFLVNYKGYRKSWVN